MKKCKTCGKFVERYVEKKSYQTVKKRSADNTHFHYGTAFYRYGICSKYHHNKYGKTKVIWDPCIPCKFRGVTRYKLKKVRGTKEINNDIIQLREEMRLLKEEMSNYKKLKAHELHSALSIASSYEENEIEESVFYPDEDYPICTLEESLPGTPRSISPTPSQQSNLPDDILEMIEQHRKGTVKKDVERNNEKKDERNVKLIEKDESSDEESSDEEMYSKFKPN